ncbi:rubrerythrin family protein [Clostridium botulinum]|uniref:Rubrerythrin family protein n=1 Tax=Clostridium botulinum TaxID=1491 RepID=A0A0M1LDZ1_CLOBO|nr:MULTISPECIES: rubrerythrin family protein [Clostridium]ACD51261.1 rubrerythrin [Clostridium botulinum E3 str. Alaska E43]AJF30668.1 rubrerythrin [Clostridium botulinum]AJF33731.1 rubrerythrin [Clostridium botulinum]KAI3344327.1 rubrerythrin family protein [Clostridium botulinum]KOM87343.1 rubrerythrin [Clostridium botulinum]
MKNFNESQTKENLMRAFAGESQARNRYNIAASVAKKEGYTILQDLFNYTANQEKAHAKEFMKRLKEFSGEEITITASYPAEMETSTLVLLKAAEKHEAAEHDEIYSGFAKVAREEGFNEIATLFDKIASIEKIHSNRFKKYADELENGSLFKKVNNDQWMCTNCGYIYEGIEAPEACPVCAHPKGYFIPFENSPFE